MTWWISLLLFLLPILGLSRLFGIHLVTPELRGFNFAGSRLTRPRAARPRGRDKAG